MRAFLPAIPLLQTLGSHSINIWIRTLIGLRPLLVRWARVGGLIVMVSAIPAAGGPTVVAKPLSASLPAKATSSNT